MANREAWEEVSFQVFTDEDGVLRSGYYPTGEGTVTGNVQVDRVWGNVPMQPDDDRTDNGYSFGGGQGDQGWDSTYSYTSDTLRISNYTNNSAVQGLFTIRPTIATDHVRADIGWSNFPGYIPNYEGDGDSGLEAVVPNVTRLNKTVGRNLINDAGLDYVNNYENPAITGTTSNGTTIRMYVDDLFGVKVGDKVWPDNVEYDYGNEEVTITAVSTSGPSTWFEFEAATAPDPALDTENDGTVWPGSNVINVILSQDREPGTIIDDNLEVEITMLGD